MNRRESFKNILVGVAAGAVITSTPGCKPEEKPEQSIVPEEFTNYGRTPAEKEHDEKVFSTTFFDEHEMTAINTLCEIILPATATAASAVEAKVPEFIEFIVKDLPYNQVPMRGGLMWLDIEANSRFGKTFPECSKDEQIKIVDDIAYPDTNNEKPELAQGIKFFDKIRGLILTGYYTSKKGLEDLGYKGNTANVWDGVPDDVLEKHGLAYEAEWLAKCVDQSKRGVTAEWDDDMNLLT